MKQYLKKKAKKPRIGQTQSKKPKGKEPDEEISE